MRIQQYYSNIIRQGSGRRGGPTFAEAQRDFKSALRSQNVTPGI
jgi:hypothetical protein